MAAKGRIPKSVITVEEFAVRIWPCPDDNGFQARDSEAQLFGIGAYLRRIGEDRGADLAYFLSALLAHRQAPYLPGPVQADFAQVGGGLV